jgi:hypothetical protein
MKKLLTSLAAYCRWLSAAPARRLPALIALDSRYEEALRVGDVPFTIPAGGRLCMGAYAWFADRNPQQPAGAAGQAGGLQGAQHQRRGACAGRNSVVRGVSTTEQWNADGTTWRTNRYQFMRTYVNVDGQCKLLSVQTMNLK